ncbi:hypothetical protein MTO96_039355 [Rhipicephalus appendiculatus]
MSLRVAGARTRFILSLAHRHTSSCSRSSRSSSLSPYSSAEKPGQPQNHPSSISFEFLVGDEEHVGLVFQGVSRCHVIEVAALASAVALQERVEEFLECSISRKRYTSNMVTWWKSETHKSHGFLAT